jgi:hypothetical protein
MLGQQRTANPQAMAQMQSMQQLSPGNMQQGVRPLGQMLGPQGVAQGQAMMQRGMMRM